jgi:GNAT superfamily N-acetyltransferase
MEPDAAGFSGPAVRVPTVEDISRLREIEASADSILPFATDPAWPAGASGEARLTAPGFILVSGQPAVGFVHVLQLGPRRWHLEQISVLADRARQGIGRALLRAALECVTQAGGGEVTLMTFADLPFNAPFYATEGFVPVGDRGCDVADGTDSASDAALERFRVAESALGMSRWGRRVAMSRTL